MTDQFFPLVYLALAALENQQHRLIQPHRRLLHSHFTRPLRITYAYVGRAVRRSPRIGPVPEDFSVPPETFPIRPCCSIYIFSFKGLLVKTAVHTEYLTLPLLRPRFSRSLL